MTRHGLGWFDIAAICFALWLLAGFPALLRESRDAADGVMYRKAIQQVVGE